MGSAEGAREGLGVETAVDEAVKPTLAEGEGEGERMTTTRVAEGVTVLEGVPVGVSVDVGVPV